VLKNGLLSKHFEGKLIAAPVVVEKAVHFHREMKLTEDQS
jgi:hypothetical protein